MTDTTDTTGNRVASAGRKGKGFRKEVTLETELF